MTRLLLLGGTSEARTVARALAPRIAVTLSLAARTDAPETDGVPTRHGGFGGADGFRAYLRESGTQIVLDATHPFAAAISRRSATISEEMGIPYLMLRREAWCPRPDDRWCYAPDAAAAVAMIDARERVFLAVGRQTLWEFKGLQATASWCRVVDPPKADYPFANGAFVQGRPPFSAQAERALFRELGVTTLVSKNAGGDSGRAKLEAARALGLRVIMIDRPDLDALPQVAMVEAALKWVEEVTCPQAG